VHALRLLVLRLAPIAAEIDAADREEGTLRPGVDLLDEPRVCLLLLPITKLFAWGGGGPWRTCATKD
jgi:hypothetical protein